ncbi:MAG: outer membrane beta-barrel protein [Pseudomonadota bacterium]
MLWSINKTNLTSLISRLFVLLALAGMSGVVQAAGAGWYMGANIGNAHAKDYKDSVGSISNIVIDDKDSAWRIYGGYHFMDILAMEVGYVDLGEVRSDGTLGGMTYSDKNEARGIDAVVVGTMGITDNISVMGRFGLFLHDVDSDTTQLGVTSKSNSRGTKYTMGLGAKYALGKKYALRFEWQRYVGVGDLTTEQSHYEVFWAGLMVNFNKK